MNPLLARVLGPARRILPFRWREPVRPQGRGRRGQPVGQWTDVLSTVTPERLRTILRAVATGTNLDLYLELAEQMQERNLHYGAVLQQRVRAIAAAPSEVRPGAEGRRAAGVADDVRTLVEDPAFHDMTLALLDGLGKGFAAAEVVWEMTPRGLRPAAYERIDPRWITFDRRDGRTPLLRDFDGALRLPGGRGAPVEGFGVPAYPFPERRIVFHAPQLKAGLPARSGLAYFCAAVSMLKGVAVRDWWAYAEVYGLPLRVGRYGPEATEEDRATLVEAVTNLASDAGAILPESLRIEFPEGRSGAQRSDLFERMARWCDEQVSKAVVGVTMTSDAGSSRAQADVHLEVRQDLIDDDQRQLMDVLNRQIVRWYVDARHGPQEHYPRIARPDEETVDVEAVGRAVEMGLPVPTAWLHRRMGIPVPADGEDVLPGRAPGAPGAPAGDGPPRPAPAALLADVGGGVEDGDWEAIARRWTGPIRQALAGAETPEQFLDAAIAAGIDAGAVQDLALRAFRARVDGETGGG